MSELSEEWENVNTSVLVVESVGRIVDCSDDIFEFVDIDAVELTVDSVDGGGDSGVVE